MSPLPRLNGAHPAAHPTMPINDSAAWQALQRHAETIATTHLRDLMRDAKRCARLTVEHDGIVLDCSRQNAGDETLRLLLELAREARVADKIAAMFAGEKINVTERRAVMHVALRAPKGERLTVEGVDVVPEVHAVLGRIRAFSDAVRSGKWKGATGKKLVDVVAIGIGGSYLGPE